MAYDLTDLKVFVAAAEEGNLSRGAERCHLSASSASLRIKNLESVLGAPLLTRRARGVIPTAAGHVLLEHARRCLAQLEQMRADLSPFTHGMSNNVTVFANNNAIGTHLPNDLAQFFRQYPDVRVTLEERMSHDILNAVVEGRADLGVVALETGHPELQFIPYKKDSLVLIAPLRHPLAAHKAIHFRDCLSFPFICLQSGAALHTFLVGHANALDQRLDVRVQVSGYWGVVRLVSSGAGVGVVPRTAIPVSEEDNLAIVDLLDPWAVRNLCVCIPRNQDIEHVQRDNLIRVLCPSFVAGQFKRL
ncbi:MULTISPECIES: LysR family transcriptional regulator [Pseudomonas]|uniref:LysR family transcriptional regulator n=1 Tax=Pseudomonas TaxID=286 RepID=UPI00053E886F|nr:MULTISPECIES: LysR family transcriptional regulator [Pseudomonas]HBN9689321.1 LysR family transcriptional regulator [Pseudomonas aeruginosa]